MHMIGMGRIILVTIVCCFFIWHGLLLSGVSAKNTLVPGEFLGPGGGRTLWQSFDHPPGNIWIPEMKLGWFGLQKTQLQQRCLTSWTSEENPSPGAFSLCVDPNNTKQLVAMRRGIVYWHSGVWNGYNFPFLQVNSHLRYFSNHNESYFAWDGDFHTGSTFIRIYATGFIFALVEDHRNYTISRINCYGNDTYYSNEGCLKSPKQSNCSGGDMFNSTTGFIESNLWEQMLFNTTLNIGDCNEMCVQNCSCKAYATLETDGTGCKFSSSTKYQYAFQGDTLYIRYGKTTAISVYTAPIVQSTQQLAGHDEDLPFFDFKCIEMATNYFSEENKLGQGGFGPVYKAWGLWIEGNVSDLIDPTMDKMISIIEATRYIQVGLLCVQDSATDRPTMTDVVSMLGNESTILPIPKQPGFSAIIGLKCGDVANNSKSCSINEVTITEIEGR
nr:G-type lectin S-receptor-like serine/threonine-protein kinase At1g67520 [Ipomoea batatas]